MKISFAADFHGQQAQYKQLFENAWRAQVDVVLLGGDLFPNGPLPLDPLADIALQQRFAEEVLFPLMEKFRRIAPDTRVFYIPGNHDWVASIPAADELWEPLDGRRVVLDGCELIGFSLIPPCPYPLKDWERLDLAGDEVVDPEEQIHCSETDGAVRKLTFEEHLRSQPTLEQALESLPFPQNPSRTVCVFHGPPHETNCDVSSEGKHLGSRAVRGYIERTQPLIALSGHVHFSPYKTSSAYDRIGKTVICNPGAGELNVHQVTFDVADPRAGIDHTIFGVAYPFSGGEIPVGPDFTL